MLPNLLEILDFHRPKLLTFLQLALLFLIDDQGDCKKGKDEESIHSLSLYVICVVVKNGLCHGAHRWQSPHERYIQVNEDGAEEGLKIQTCL